MTRPALAAGLTALAVVTACGDGIVDDPGDGDVAATVVADGFVVGDAWTRPTPPGRTEAAIYLTIRNRDAPADRFIGSASDQCITMQPHLTSIDDEDVASMVTAGGDQLGLPSGGELVLEPNGLHLMCLGLPGPLAIGDTFDVELQFSEHEPVTVPVVVEQR